MTSKIQIVRLSDTGQLRERNEDTVSSDESIGLALLADGMGGYNAGDVASQMASLTITAELKTAFNAALTAEKTPTVSEIKNYLQHAVDTANEAILKVAQSQQQCEGMGTTILTALFHHNKAIIGHIGDSRAYCFKNQTLTQITTDHSLVQAHVNAGLVDQQDAEKVSYKNYLTKALGIDAVCALETTIVDTERNDVFLLCSDGLTDMLSHQEIEAILLENNNLSILAESLVQNANNRGGKDNISVILVEILEQSIEGNPGWLKSMIKKVVR